MKNVLLRLAGLATEAAKRASRFPPPRFRRPLLAVAAAIFLIGTVVTARSLNLVWHELGWGWILTAAALGVPMTILNKAAEFQISGRIIDAHIGLAHAVKVSVLSTAANLLPLPGSALVRIQALKQAGYPYRRATYTTAVMGFAWVGVAGTAAGCLLISFGKAALGSGLAVASGLVLALAIIAANRLFPTGSRLRLAAAVIGVETLAVGIGAFRLYLILLALDEPATLTAATLLTLASVLASAVGVFPGGLGLRELLASALIPLADLGSAVGFLASAVDRIVGLAVHAPMAILYSFRND